MVRVAAAAAAGVMAACCARILLYLRRGSNCATHARTHARHRCTRENTNRASDNLRARAERGPGRSGGGGGGGGTPLPLTGSEDGRRA